MGDRPHFETDGAVACFERFLSNAEFYVEFGSGGSTVLAARLGVKTLSIDSDRWFHDAVRKRARCGSIDYRSINIGATGPWGIPLNRSDASGFSRAKYARYSNLWGHLAASKMEMFPDLILIDGRFRLACALRSAKAANAQSLRPLIAFDDYLNRDYYHRFDAFADRVEVQGNWVLFKPKASIDAQKLDRAISHALFDWR